MEGSLEPVDDLVGVVLGNVSDVDFAFHISRHPVVRIFTDVDAGSGGCGLPDRLDRDRKAPCERVQAAN